MSCSDSPLEQLAALLHEDELLALRALASSFDASPDKIPQLRRVMEDIAIVRNVTELMAEGERSHRNAMVRTGRTLGMPYETVRYRYHRALDVG